MARARKRRERSPDTDRPIKVLFERQGQSLLPFIGEADPGVRVAAVESVELAVPSRTVDSVLRLEREGLVWYRHLEFQSGPDPDMPRRCFEYNSRLILHYDTPVFTTVLYLVPGSDSGARNAFRLFLGDRLAYEWRFDVVRLWEIDVGVALDSGQAGPLALVPLLRGGGMSRTGCSRRRACSTGCRARSRPTRWRLCWTSRAGDIIEHVLERARKGPRHAVVAVAARAGRGRSAGRGAGTGRG